MSEYRVFDEIEFNHGTLHGIGIIYSVWETKVFTFVIETLNGFEDFDGSLDSTCHKEMREILGFDKYNGWVVSKSNIIRKIKSEDYD